MLTPNAQVFFTQDILIGTPYQAVFHPLRQSAYEHAIAKKLLESKDVENVFVAPGNDGMTLDGLDLVTFEFPNILS